MSLEPILAGIIVGIITGVVTAKFSAGLTNFNDRRDNLEALLAELKVNRERANSQLKAFNGKVEKLGIPFLKVSYTSLLQSGLHSEVPEEIRIELDTAYDLIDILNPLYQVGAESTDPKHTFKRLGQLRDTLQELIGRLDGYLEITGYRKGYLSYLKKSVVEKKVDEDLEGV